jgi:hypothetical protein
MNTLFDQDAMQGIIKRIESLTPESPRQWGKMNAPGMLAHCSVSLGNALGDFTLKQSFIGKLLGRIALKRMMSDKPFDKNLPTEKTYIITDERDLKNEKENILNLIARFNKTGPDGLTKSPHPFFGELTGEQWGVLQWKHLNHHLMQFSA